MSSHVLVHTSDAVYSGGQCTAIVSLHLCCSVNSWKASEIYVDGGEIDVDKHGGGVGTDVVGGGVGADVVGGVVNVDIDVDGGALDVVDPRLQTLGS